MCCMSEKMVSFITLLLIKTYRENNWIFCNDNAIYFELLKQYVNIIKLFENYKIVEV